MNSQKIPRLCGALPPESTAPLGTHDKEASEAFVEMPHEIGDNPGRGRLHSQFEDRDVATAASSFAALHEMYHGIPPVGDELPDESELDVVADLFQ